MYKKFEVSDTLTVETGTGGKVYVDRSTGGLVQIEPSEVEVLAFALILCQDDAGDLATQFCRLLDAHANGGGAGADPVCARCGKRLAGASPYWTGDGAGVWLCDDCADGADADRAMAEADKVAAAGVAFIGGDDGGL